MNKTKGSLLLIFVHIKQDHLGQRLVLLKGVRPYRKRVIVELVLDVCVDVLEVMRQG